MSEVKSVCIIDDDNIYTYGIKKIINNYLPGNEVITYENGRKALEAIRNLVETGEKLPDLILLDIDMPEMNGWDFLHEFESLRSQISKDIQIFVISSQVTKKKHEIYKVEWDEKVSDFIQKPVDVNRLKELLED